MADWILLAAPLEDIRGLKPFIVTGPNPWAIALVALVGGVLGLVFLYLARRMPAPERTPVQAPPDPPETIRGRLDALAKSRLAESGEATRFCDHLSEILRDFLLQRYGLSSRRLTSSELLEELSRRQVPGAVHTHVEAVVTACDLVKFAKVRLSGQKLTQALTSAYLILDFVDLSNQPSEPGGTP